MTLEQWAATFADAVTQSESGRLAEVAVLSQPFPQAEFVASPGGLHALGEEVAQICRRPPLSLPWVAFYGYEGPHLDLVAVAGPVDLPRRLMPTQRGGVGRDVPFPLTRLRPQDVEELPWLPFDLFHSGPEDRTRRWRRVRALPLMIFRQLCGLACVDVANAHQLRAELLAHFAALSHRLTSLLFVLRQGLTRICGLCGNIPATEVVREASFEERSKAELDPTSLFPELVGQSGPFLQALSLAQRWAVGRAPVLITGETGTGKELLARAIHALSDRRNGPWVAVNCPAIPRELAESELFGHEKGAFTGATEARPGRFERADGGVLFLDEVGDLPHTIQAKLLRVLQEGEIERVGSSRSRRVDVRIIAATNRDLLEAVRSGEFRRDLYHRLAALPIHLPPLRERLGDIELLTMHFLKKSQQHYNKRIEKIAPGAMEKLRAYDWPGNVRELEYVIERAVLLAVEPVLRPEDIADLQSPAPAGASLHAQLRTEKRRRVEATLRYTRGNCAEAARILGMSRGNFSRLLKALRVDAQRFRAA